MALVQLYEMNSIIKEALIAVRRKAAEFDLNEGAIAICCSDNAPLSGIRRIACFDLLPGEECLHIFPIKDGGSLIVRNEHLEDEVDCFGIVAAKIAAARNAYNKDLCVPLTSRESCIADNIPGRQNWGGCVTYPLRINGHLCGFIYVAVSGGTERQDELCAWEAHGPISRGLAACCTSNPGRIAYEERN